MPWRKWHKQLKFWSLTVILCALGVLAALTLSRFFDAFYANTPRGYEPKDSAREKTLEQKPAGETDR